MEIGEKLRNLRIQKNLTQEELGERTDLSKGYISQLERDLSSPSMETFFSILPVIITFDKNGEYKTFEPSLSETFIYVIDGSIRLTLGEATYIAKKGQTMYYQATEPHQISNNGRGKSRALIVATESYL